MEAAIIHAQRNSGQAARSDNGEEARSPRTKHFLERNL